MDIIPVFGAVSIVAALASLWWGLTSRPSAARSRLVAGLPEESAEPSPIVEGMRRLGQSARHRLPGPLVDGLEVNLVQANYPGGLDLPRIIGVKITLGLFGAASTMLVTGQVFFAAIAGAALFFLPDYWVVSVRDQRRTEIQSAAADIIDQLTICVEAGLGFDSALARVARTTDGALTEELLHAMSDIRGGVPRARALRALADRVQVPEIRQLVNAVLQAQKHGVSIAETLRVQSAEMRMKRTQRTEERAAKLTVKLIFPIVVCFLPVFLIITMVPALITIFRAL